MIGTPDLGSDSKRLIRLEKRMVYGVLLLAL